MRKISQQTFSRVDATDEDLERGNWSNPIEFFLSCLGYIVGLGNIWRFPYLVYRNGGGAFFIPYFILLFTCGLPLVLMELSIGQYWSEGVMTVWKIAPLFKGIGISMMFICFFCIVYYCMITGWALHYLVFSLRAVLPWACCKAPWATERCVSFVQQTKACADSGWPNKTQVWTHSSKFAADEYFHNFILSISSGLHSMGTVQWPALVALIIAWIITFAVLARGVKSLGKFSYVTATLPYAVLITLLIRTAMQPGAKEGVIFYLTPTWSLLKSARVWGDAASQIFYSTGVCFGCTITLASYNKFRHNIYRDACILALGNSCTSLLSGFVVFSILGFMAHSQNTTVGSLVTSGPGLTFIAYPQAVTLLPLSPLWSTLFFLMLSMVALSSMFPMVENIITTLIDQFPDLLRPYKFWVAMAVCLISMVLGIVFTTNGGMYVLQLFDTYAVGQALLFVGLTEVMVIAWRYGVRRLARNIRRMVSNPYGLSVFMAAWFVVSPCVLLFAIIFSLVMAKPVEYGDYIFTTTGTVTGWLLTAVSVLPIPVYAIVRLITYLVKKEGGPNTNLRNALDRLTLSEECKRNDRNNYFY